MVFLCSGIDVQELASASRAEVKLGQLLGTSNHPRNFFQDMVGGSFYVSSIRGRVSCTTRKRGRFARLVYAAGQLGAFKVKQKPGVQKCPPDIYKVHNLILLSCPLPIAYVAGLP